MPPRYSMQGAKGAFFGQGSKQLTPTNMDPSDESAQLVSQMKIELRLNENLCHGNNQIDAHRKENLPENLHQRLHLEQF